MDIKTKVKKTLLIEPAIKEKILSIKGILPDKLEKYLSSFFAKYENIENDIIDDIYRQIPFIYIKTIQDLENQARNKELIEIEELEKEFI